MTPVAPSSTTQHGDGVLARYQKKRKNSSSTTKSAGGLLSSSTSSALLSCFSNSAFSPFETTVSKAIQPRIASLVVSRILQSAPLLFSGSLETTSVTSVAESLRSTLDDVRSRLDSSATSRSTDRPFIHASLGDFCFSCLDPLNQHSLELAACRIIAVNP